MPAIEGFLLVFAICILQQSLCQIATFFKDTTSNHRPKQYKAVHGW